MSHLPLLLLHSALIFMRGVKSEDMSAILDFLYCGEASVFQENLGPFLALAEELKLKGLMGQTTNPEDILQEPFSKFQMEQRGVKATKLEPELLTDFSPLNTEKQLLIADSNREQRIETSERVSSNLQELDAHVKSMMDQGQKMVPDGKTQRRAKICKMCGKEGAPNSIRDHIETHHLEGIALPCNSCEKTFRSRAALRQHKFKYCAGRDIV